MKKLIQCIAICFMLAPIFTYGMEDQEVKPGDKLSGTFGTPNKNCSLVDCLETHLSTKGKPCTTVDIGGDRLCATAEIKCKYQCKKTN